MRKRSTVDMNDHTERLFYLLTGSNEPKIDKCSNGDARNGVIAELANKLEG